MNINSLNPLILSRSVVLSLLVWGNAAHAVSVGLADVPLYVMEAVDPNIYLSLDDSGSMYWSYMPDDIEYYFYLNAVKSSSFNKIYYDPNVRYTPPVDENGTSLGDASFTAAWNDGYDQTGCTVDLSQDYRPTWGDGDHCDTDVGSLEYASTEPEHAYYYVLNEGADPMLDDSYTKVVVSSTSAPDGRDETANFANWYSYYRKRIYITKTAASLAFAGLSNEMRIAHQTINGGGDNELSQPAKFEGSAKADFFTWLYDVPASGSTPLRAALKNVGDALSNDDAPYRDDPTNSISPARSCRQNFHIMMTDGYWNSDGGIGGNQDDMAHSLPLNDYGISNYAAMPPYQDDNTDYLADTAFYYWVTDLRPAMDNDVPPSILDTSSDFDGDGSVEKSEIFWNPKNDPANWQHMVTYTIGLGVEGNLSFPADYTALLNGTETWGTNQIDDLWHAAINGRGDYYSATNAKEMVDALGSALAALLEQKSTAAPVSLNSGSISSETRLFQVMFHTTDWTGQVFSFPISTGDGNATCSTADLIGEVCKAEWEASCQLDGGFCEATGSSATGLDWSTGRRIITMNSSTGDGVPFRWSAAISADQQTLLDAGDGLGEKRLEYLRGNQSLEGNYFRSRKSLLGDIINSNPLYIGSPPRFYPDSLETSTYKAFRSSNANRTPLVYVGANDGMLHAFDSTTGVEKLAYVPNAVFSNLPKLTHPAYAHTNYVDGKLNEGDVFFDSAWHTVVVGGLGLGGQGVYALDVTKPDNFTEANASSIVLWEYTDQDDAADSSSADLGFTYGKPFIGKLNNGQWAAIFGNGFDSLQADGHVSSTGQAAVYIIDIQNGTLIKKIIADSKTGVVDPTGAGRPNALVSVQPVDINGDYLIDYLYGGDLFGNVWRFNLVGNTNGWDIAFGEPLYQAKDSGGKAQPITTLTAVGRHPSNVGLMIYFGTGKYYGTGDLLDNSGQTFYGIWDRWFDGDADIDYDESDFGGGYDRASLLQQEVLGTNSSQFKYVDARVTSDYPVDWETQFGWYLDLPEVGERVHQDPFLRNDRIVFVTVTPSDDPCRAGGSSWLMELDARDGSRLDKSPFDYDGQNGVSEEDLVDFDSDGDGSTDKVVGSGVRRKVIGDSGGIYTIPAVLKLPTEDKERKYMATSKGSIETVEESSGRRLKRSWREIR
jgi:type IV pilus assembly protein PilY1